MPIHHEAYVIIDFNDEIYFRQYFEEDGTYTIKVSNISENPINLQIEFGDTHSQKMLAPGLMILVGSLILMLISYLKI